MVRSAAQQRVSNHGPPDQCPPSSFETPAFCEGGLLRMRAPLIRIDREIPQPQVGEAALFPQAKQAPVDGEPQRVVAALDRDADALAEVAALDERPARECAAVSRIRAVEPEREGETIAEQEVDLAPPQRLACDLGGLVRAHLGL